MSKYNIKVPPGEVVSPEDGKVVKFSSYTKDFYDEQGNSVEPHQLSASRPANRIKKFFKRMFGV